ncbi:MAG: SprT-like domain-containing protein [Gammaproteobacteria bacterium]
MNNIIQPINDAQCQQVCELTQTYIERAMRIFEFKKVDVPVLFDLKGRASGMYRVRRGGRCIRFNPYIFSKYFEDNLASTVPHEVAHYVTDRVYGLRNIRPHGKEWQQVMHEFDVPPQVTGTYDLAGIPIRRQRRVSYHCGCATHDLTLQRHNKCQRGDVIYRCVKCGESLEPAGK